MTPPSVPGQIFPNRVGVDKRFTTSVPSELAPSPSTPLSRLSQQLSRLFVNNVTAPVSEVKISEAMGSRNTTFAFVGTTSEQNVGNHDIVTEALVGDCTRRSLGVNPLHTPSLTVVDDNLSTRDTVSPKRARGI